ncbi:hypothetical protein B9Z55_014674 [Caenorhabditis nigoni]|uniref:Uncharacterized protein n=1 Tax=Caenorhabditis nigoni TaxID=1611254 RepID=A0A2G5U6U9_9PELO|nr:hypothetical protein B9Z55_014674 [Caenorhabditis nigoni]
MVQTTTLVKVAAGVFVMGSTGLYLAQKSVQWKVRKLPHYNESLKIVFEHPKALLRIPVTGLVDCGFMDVLAVRETEKENFETAKVRLYLNDGVYTIFDTGRWQEDEEQ